VDQPAAPKGYVQGYVLDTSSSNIGWLQQTAGSSQTFNYRYPGVFNDTKTTPGFGNAVAWIDNEVIVGQAQPGSDGNAQYLVMDWATIPYDRQTNALLIRATVDPGKGQPEPFTQTPMYRAPSGQSQRYNVTMDSTNNDNNLLFTTWNNAAGDVISIQNPLGNDAQPFSKFETVQNLGAGVSSQAATIPGTTRVGFGQGTNTWLSRTGLTVRLTTNDPAWSNGQGRVIIWSKIRSS
jgi:hypothetical protein